MMLQLEERNSLKRLLTLRYDTKEEGPLAKKTWVDWNPTESDPEGIGTRDRLYMSIVNNLIKYDTIGIALSSGVDSSLLLALLREAFPKKKIIAVHYLGVNNDELEPSKKLAEKFNCEFHAFESTPVYDRIEFMIKMMNSPKWDCYDYLIPKVAKMDGCDVLVTGDGADELYAGYTFRYQKFDSMMHIGKDTLSMITHLVYDYLDCHQHDYVEDQELLLNDFDWEIQIEPFLWQNFSNPLEPLQKVIMADFNGKLVHNFAIKKQKFSQQFEIPIFSPFLDKPILEYASHIPLKEKYHNGIGKLPLRKICNRYGLEPPIKKLGFTHDIKTEYSKYYKDYLNVICNEEALMYKLGIINFEWTRKHVVPMPTEERVINKLVSLYTLEKYLQWKN